MYKFDNLLLNDIITLIELVKENHDKIEILPTGIYIKNKNLLPDKLYKHITSFSNAKLIAYEELNEIRLVLPISEQNVELNKEEIYV